MLFKTLIVNQLCIGMMRELALKLRQTQSQFANWMFPTIQYQPSPLAIQIVALQQNLSNHRKDIDC
ncbi:hypothetical protein [Chroogloeocystis siderophila]|jgi:hypothetical protein|uniref:Uncharacterized protein n=1 Tax=Chroogloeocystis siderophila 5.2 s.c.1 TaxID=247279 RepID=A0A1U7HQQ5_9CHRO|nr:hypothetical protein [Chroogloeocystis siderophila]OKH25878.1 hypothetical protein NIES1031_12915 [Chroogloeocystis siderophila 5.2 s.c.1]